MGAFTRTGPGMAALGAKGKKPVIRFLGIPVPQPATEGDGGQRPRRRGRRGRPSILRREFVDEQSGLQETFGT